MSTLSCIESYVDKDKNYYGCFLIEPLQAGQGITLGNALRRTLLSDLSGFAVSGVRINNLKHEFSTIEGLREDVLEVLLNLKEIIFQSSFLPKFRAKQLKLENFQLKGFLSVKGPLVVTAGMFHLPKDMLKIINPNQYICTLVTEDEFYLEIDIEKGIGYKLTQDARKENLVEKFQISKPATLYVDALYAPIKRINYKIKLIHDTQGNIKESLCFEIFTNGSITPKRSLQEGVKLLLNLFYPLLITNEFFPISETFCNNSKK